MKSPDLFTKSPFSQDVIVVGAGIGGLSAATKLQAEGHRVSLLEARERLGASARRSDVTFGFTMIPIPQEICRIIYIYVTIYIYVCNYLTMYLI